MDVNLKPRPPPPGPAPPLSGCICSCCGCSSLSTPRTGDVAVVFRSSVPAKQLLEQFEDGFLSVLMAHGYVDSVKWDSACVKAVAVSPLLLALVPWQPTRLGCSVRQGVATLLLGTILARWALAMARQTLVHRHARHQLQPVPSDRPAQERLCSAGVWSCACNVRTASAPHLVRNCSEVMTS